jgi:Zn ribbon nucleic-acid-binding protein
LIIDQSPSMAKCPKCKTSGPYNFRLEERVSFKQPDPSYPDVLNSVGSKTVYACIKCGHIVKDA